MTVRPHTIRLRGPWSYQPLARTVRLPGGTTEVEPDGEPLPPEGTQRMPGDWSETLGANFRGRVRFTRHFHRPTGLDARDRVDLVLAEVEGSAELVLNDQPLGRIALGAGAARFEVSDHLQLRNLLQVDVELPRESDGGGSADSPHRGGGLVGVVQLEIFAGQAADSEPSA